MWFSVVCDTPVCIGLIVCESLIIVICIHIYDLYIKASELSVYMGMQCFANWQAYSLCKIDFVLPFSNMKTGTANIFCKLLHLCHKSLAV